MAIYHRRSTLWCHITCLTFLQTRLTSRRDRSVIAVPASKETWAMDICCTALGTTAMTMVGKPSRATRISLLKATCC